MIKHHQASLTSLVAEGEKMRMKTISFFFSVLLEPTTDKANFTSFIKGKFLQVHLLFPKVEQRRVDTG